MTDTMKIVCRMDCKHNWEGNCMKLKIIISKFNQCLEYEKK